MNAGLLFPRFWQKHIKEQIMKRAKYHYEKTLQKIKDLESEIRSNREKAAMWKDRMHKEEGKGFYVYGVFVDGKGVYVGKGKGDRYKHPVSGCSSVKRLNEDYFNGKYIEVRFLEKYVTEQEALEKEKHWIGMFSTFIDYLPEGEVSYLYNKDVPEKFDYWDIGENQIYHLYSTPAIAVGPVPVIPPFEDYSYDEDRV